MKILKKISFCAFILSIPVFLVTINISFLINERHIYDYIITKYNIPLITGIDEIQLKKIYKNWVDYYNCKVSSPQVTIYKNSHKVELLSEKEIIHLEDVKNLVRLNYIVLLLSTICILLNGGLTLNIYDDKWKIIIRGLLTGCLITIGIMFLLIFLSLCCFDELFLFFHQVSFSNQFWILDPTKDYLIMMFPGGFFYDIAIFGFCLVNIEALLLVGCCLGFSKWLCKN